MRSTHYLIAGSVLLVVSFAANTIDGSPWIELVENLKKHEDLPFPIGHVLVTSFGYGTGYLASLLLSLKALLDMPSTHMLYKVGGVVLAASAIGGAIAFLPLIGFIFFFILMLLYNIGNN